MRKLIVLSSITLDGVMQSMGGQDEDQSDGFKFGGWSTPYGEEVSHNIVMEEMNQSVDYLLGGKTFEIWESYWPKHKGLWPGINKGVKYVFSNSRVHSDWENTVFIKTLSDIEILKNSEGPDIQVWGSSKLVQLLIKNGLVDELRLKIFPLTLGKGKKLFDSDTNPTSFQLTDSLTTTKGVIIVNYKKIGDVNPGTTSL